MKYLFLLLLAVIPTQLRAQQTATVLIFTNAPSGSCPARRLAVATVSGGLYYCDANTHVWTTITATGGGSYFNSCTAIASATGAVAVNMATAGSGSVPCNSIDLTLTGNTTLTITNPASIMTILLHQDGSGNHSITFATATSTCASNIDLAASSLTIQTLVYAGGAVYGDGCIAKDNPQGFVFFGVNGSLPSACSAGQLAFITDATAGQNVKGCTTPGSPGTWTVQGGAGGGTTHETVPLRMSPCGGNTNAVIAAGGVGGCQGTGSFAELIFAGGSVRLSFTVPKHWTGGTPTFYTRATEVFGNAGTVTITAALASLSSGTDLSAPSYNTSSNVVITVSANIQVVTDGVIGPLAVSGMSTLVAGQLAEILITGTAGTFPNTYVRLYDSILDFPVN